MHLFRMRPGRAAGGKGVRKMKRKPMKAVISYHSAVLFVQDIAAAKAFYLNVLDQQIEADFGRCVILGCGLSLWQVPAGHAVSPAEKQDGSSRFEICFETEGCMKAVLKRLKASGVSFLHEIKEESWGQQTVRFYDPDGHLVELGENLQTFVRRLYQESGSAEAVAKRTSVPLEMVREIIG